MRGSRPEVAVSTPPGCGARWHAAYSAVRANERVAAVLPGVAHANLRRGGGVAVISEVLRAAELSPVDGRRLVASLRAPASKRSAGIPEHPREGRPARRCAETRQARSRTPARLEEPPPCTPLRRGENDEKGTHHEGTTRTCRLNGKLSERLINGAVTPPSGPALPAVPTGPGSRPRMWCMG